MVTATAIEYGLIAAGIVLVIITAVNLLFSKKAKSAELAPPAISQTLSR